MAFFMTTTHSSNEHLFPVYISLEWPNTIGKVLGTFACELVGPNKENKNYPYQIRIVEFITCGWNDRSINPVEREPITSVEQLPNPIVELEKLPEPIASEVKALLGVILWGDSVPDALPAGSFMKEALKALGIELEKNAKIRQLSPRYIYNPLDERFSGKKR